jgi:hypothetical protein
MKNVLRFAAVAEAATGLALIVLPSLVVRLLFGVELTDASLSIARVTGMALVGLGIACWPGCTAFCGMLTYSGLVTLYLAYVGLVERLTGILLWPAVVLHAVLTLLLARLWFKTRENTST